MARPAKGYALDGEPVPGTTTVCGMLNKAALVGWAGKLCTEVAWRAGRAGEPLPHWAEVLYGTRDAAAAAGTLVHEAFEAHLHGRPIPVFPDSAIGTQAQQGFANALHWLRSSGFSVEAHERPLVSRQYRYGGTPDLLLRTENTVTLGDVKTGTIYPEMLLQMAAYRQLLRECDGIDSQGVHLVRFHRDYGDFAHHFFADDALDLGWEVFRRLLEMHPTLKQLEQRVK